MMKEPSPSVRLWAARVADLLARNGIEVASGLYIYLVEYDGGRHVGYFSVLF